jgi:hypothetical protein
MQTYAGAGAETNGINYPFGPLTRPHPEEAVVTSAFA